MEKRQLIVDGKSIEYILIHRSNMTRQRIKIDKDAQVIVSCNPRVSKRTIEQFVLKNAQWILDNIAKIKLKSVIQPQRKYEDGEKFLFLGKEYRLMVNYSRKTSFYLFGETMLLSLPATDDFEQKQKIVARWYKKQIASHLAQSYDAIVGKYPHLFYGKATLKIRDMKTKWGVCRTKTVGVGCGQKTTRTITLNSRLIFARQEIIDAIILHELVHIYHPNHQKAFYDMLIGLCPDYKTLVKELNKTILDYTI